MLTKIIKIRNVGLLSNATVDGVVDMSRVTLIYGENGRGKSTLASILRSCSLGDGQRIIAQQTIDSTALPEIDFLVNDDKSNLSAEYVNGAWTGTQPEIAVFDSEFCDDNVYSGFEVRSDQRQSLLNFALGDQTVQLKHKMDKITNDISDQTKRRSDAEKVLKIPAGPFALAKYAGSKKPDDAKDQKILLEARLQAARNAAEISSRPDPAPLPLLNLPVQDAFGVFRKTLADIETASEKLVSEHLSSHGNPLLEEWIGEGQDFVTAETCPFCGTPVDGIELVKAYQKFFNAEYQQLKEEVLKSANLLDDSLSSSMLQTLIAKTENNSTIVDTWKTQLNLSPPVLSKDGVSKSLDTMRLQFAEMASTKKQAILEVVGTSEEYETAEKGLAEFNQHILAYNSSLEVIIKEITAYKETLAKENIVSIQREIAELSALEQLDNPSVAKALSDYKDAAQERSRLESEKTKARGQIDAQMKTTLADYQTTINGLLTSFGAQFSIEQLKPTYVGSGEPRTEYGLNVRKTSLSLGSRTDRFVGPSFANALSEGDKRTLAFAFFMARLLADKNLANRIIVLDDPVASLDRSRRFESIRQITALSEKCRQLVVLSHDPYFIRELNEKIDAIKPKPPKATNLMITRGVSDYSVFANCSIDELCESEYFGNYRLVREYVEKASGDPKLVAVALRPLLEGYYHRKFPDLIPRHLIFGQMIDFFEKASPSTPLSHLGSSIEDLKVFNKYAGQFHHDTDPHAGTNPIVHAELSTFASQALDLIYRS